MDSMNLNILLPLTKWVSSVEIFHSKLPVANSANRHGTDACCHGSDIHRNRLLPLPVFGQNVMYMQANWASGKRRCITGSAVRWRAWALWIRRMCERQFSGCKKQHDPLRNQALGPLTHTVLSFKVWCLSVMDFFAGKARSQTAGRCLGSANINLTLNLLSQRTLFVPRAAFNGQQQLLRPHRTLVSKRQSCPGAFSPGEAH